MKVCWITSSYIKNKTDSTSVFLHELAKRLVEHGIEIHIITPISQGSAVEEIIEGVKIHRFSFFLQKYDKLTYGTGMAVNLKKHSIAKVQLMPYAIFCIRSFYNLHKKERFDMIHAHWAFPSGFIGSIIKNFYTIPIITTLHGTEIFLGDKYKIARYLIGYCLKYSDTVISNSSYTMQQSKKICKREYAVIPMGVDVKKYSQLSLKEIAEQKEKYELQGKKILLTVCRLIERKGVKYILESLNYIRSSNICVIIVGKGPEKEILIENANQLMKKKNTLQIIFKSGVPEKELIQLHHMCDIELLTSIVDNTGETEGLGVVLIEGASCGKPLIGSNVGGIPDIIIEGYNGFLIEQKNSKLLAEKIDYLLENRDIRIRMGNNSRINATKLFDIQNIVKKNIQIYEHNMQE
jgi:glycosyltransferase involved in cell wall biosynthesis